MELTIAAPDRGEYSLENELPLWKEIEKRWMGMKLFHFPYTMPEYRRMFRQMYRRLFLVFTAVFLVAAGMYYSIHAQNRRNEDAQIAEKVNSYASAALMKLRDLTYNLGASQEITEMRNAATGEFDPTYYYAAQRELISYKVLNRQVNGLAVYIYDAIYVATDKEVVSVEDYQEALAPGVAFSQYANRSVTHVLLPQRIKKCSWTTRCR